MSVPGTVEIAAEYEIGTSAAVPGTGPRVRYTLTSGTPDQRTPKNAPGGRGSIRNSNFEIREFPRSVCEPTNGITHAPDGGARTGLEVVAARQPPAAAHHNGIGIHLGRAQPH